jgi:hypothetical protein
VQKGAFLKGLREEIGDVERMLKAMIKSLESKKRQLILPDGCPFSF